MIIEDLKDDIALRKLLSPERISGRIFKQIFNRECNTKEFPGLRNTLFFQTYILYSNKTPDDICFKNDLDNLINDYFIQKHESGSTNKDLYRELYSLISNVDLR